MCSCKFDQGTIIYGVRSEKYPEGPCYGVIITAMCDIAQRKVPTYYYLTALDASAWFCSAFGFAQTYASKRKQLREKIYASARELELDGDTLIKQPPSALAMIVSAKREEICGCKSSAKKVTALEKQIDDYHKVSTYSESVDERKKVIKDNYKEALQFLKDVDSGKRHHFYYLPQVAYLDNGVKSKGLIVDMLEISALLPKDVEMIISPFSHGIDYRCLPKLPSIDDLKEKNAFDEKNFRIIKEFVRLKNAFWLEDNSDFVDIEGKISSPWREHLMQRFSNVFVRIGLENPEESDFISVITNCFEENCQ